MDGKRSNVSYFTSSEMKKGVKEKWNLPNRSGREILILKRVQMMCFFKKKKEKRKRKKGESKEEVLSEVSRLDGRKRGIKENLVQTKSQLYVYSCRYTLLPRIFPR